MDHGEEKTGMRSRALRSVVTVPRGDAEYDTTCIKVNDKA